MTNYIEEMMKTAGVTKHTIEICTKICPTKNLACEERTEINLETTHPDFTAEKQIEVIKLIGLERGFKVIINEGYDYILAEDMYADDQYNKQGYSTTDFAQALAQLTTELMNAGELDKQEIKKILERK